jgi:RNA polymerase sigma-70 factor, ECF subfamily
LGEPELESERDTRFNAMFDTHAGRVYAYAVRRSTPDVANEVVGETFLIAWRKLDGVPGDPLPWLLNVARKVLANRRRSAERQQAFATNLARSLRSSPLFDPADAIPTKLAIEAALDRLPPAEREALALVAWDGLDVGAGATAAGCTRATFSVRLHRARRRVMKELGLSRHPQTNALPGRPVPAKEAKST